MAIDELRKARIKRQASTHVVLIPRLLTTRWLRSLYKVADVIFDVPIGQPFWPTTNYEPLIVAICFPFISRKPWQLQGTPRMLNVKRSLQKMWGAESVDGRNLLRKLCEDAWKLDALPLELVRRMLWLPGQDVSRGEAQECGTGGR